MLLPTRASQMGLITAAENAYDRLRRIGKVTLGVDEDKYNVDDCL